MSGKPGGKLANIRCERGKSLQFSGTFAIPKTLLLGLPRPPPPPAYDAKSRQHLPGQEGILTGV